MSKDVIVVGWTPTAPGQAAVEAAVAEAGRRDARAARGQRQQR